MIRIGRMLRVPIAACEAKLIDGKVVALPREAWQPREDCLTQKMKKPPTVRGGGNSNQSRAYNGSDEVEKRSRQPVHINGCQGAYTKPSIPIESAEPSCGRAPSLSPQAPARVRRCVRPLLASVATLIPNWPSGQDAGRRRMQAHLPRLKIRVLLLEAEQRVGCRFILTAYRGDGGPPVSCLRRFANSSCALASRSTLLASSEPVDKRGSAMTHSHLKWARTGGRAGDAMTRFCLLNWPGGASAPDAGRTPKPLVRAETSPKTIASGPCRSCFT